jgi:predicted nucleotidyltransferase
MRKEKDRDFLETEEGMFFCVAGYLHPPDKVTAYLKYSPVAKGKWKKDAVEFRRELPFYHVFSVSKTIKYLEKNYPNYVHFCPIRQIKISMVPKKYIKQYYEPENRMDQLICSPEDELEEKVKMFVEEIMDEAGIPLRFLGITGSILIALHNPLFSDIDLIVYGKENALKLKNTLKTLENVKILSGEKKEEWIQHKIEIFHLNKEQAKIFANRKWNYGFYRNTYFSVHPTRTDATITERYGSVQYTGMGAATVKAEVTESSESMFLPARYDIEVLELIEGKNVLIEEIISYEGIYCDVFREGEKIEARGRLEHVDGKYRIVLGTLEVKNQYIRFI